MLYYLVYVSYATEPLDEPSLEKLMAQSQKDNLSEKITGLLLYIEGKFIQVLEGKREIILDLYEKIKTDPRHEKVSILIEGNIKERNYPDWTMAYRTMKREEVKERLGFADIDEYFKSHEIMEDSHVTEIFMKLFYDKNYKDLNPI